MPSVYFSPAFNEVTLDSSGNPANGYKLYTYDAGTTTPRATYTDQTGNSAQANPIVLNARGEPDNPIWLLSGETKFILKTSADVSVRTIDDVTGVGTLASQNISLGGYGFTNVGVLTGGTDTAETVNGVSPSWQRNGTTLATAGIAQTMWSADTVGANYSFAKSRGAAIGTDTIVVSGDALGTITAYGSNGTTFDPAARISFLSGGTPGASADMPGAIVLETCADGSATLTERVRVNAAGGVLVAGLTTGRMMFTGTSGLLTASSAATYTDGGPLTITSGTNPLSTVCSGAAAAIVYGCWHQATSGDNVFITFYTEGSATARGSIDYNRGGGAVRYNTTSDYRLKDLFGGYTGATEVINALPVHLGQMHGATMKRPMMVAHEAQAIVPYAVSGTKDAVKEDGTPDYQMVDHQIFVPLLIAALQEANARIAKLEAAIQQ